MEKRVASFRIDQELLDWLDEQAGFLGQSKAELLGDALQLARRTLVDAHKNYSAMLHELARRYGEESTMLVWVEEVDGEARARILVAGKEPDNLRGHISFSPDGKTAHVFLELADWWHEAHGTAHLGSEILASNGPIRAIAGLPWPQTVPMTARGGTIGDLIHGGARKAEAEARELAEL
jgi:hypothetical protein